MSVFQQPSDLKTVLPERIWSRLSIDNQGCWLWPGARNQGGYGIVSFHKNLWVVHRLIYSVWRGDPADLDVDHVCRVRLCARPDDRHLEAVTRFVNIERGAGHGGVLNEALVGNAAVQSAKTHCPRGHEYDKDNTYVNPTTGHRACRTCQRSHQRAYAVRKSS